MTPPEQGAAASERALVETSMETIYQAIGTTYVHGAPLTALRVVRKHVAALEARLGCAADLRLRAEREPLFVDISDYSDEFCAGFLAGQVNALDALAPAEPSSFSSSGAAG